MKKIEEQLKDEINKSVLLPDIKENIRSKIVLNDKENYETEAANNQANIATLKAKYLKIVVSLFLVIAIATSAIILGIYFYLAKNPHAFPPAFIEGNVYVRIAINPSVELTLDNNGKVTAQKGLNKDGVTLLYKKSFVGLTAEEASLSIITSAELYGYLDTVNDLHLSVIANDTLRAESISNSIINSISPKFKDKKIVTPRDDTALVNEAKAKGISVEKWQIIKIAMGLGYSESELINKSVDDLLDIVEDAEELEEYLKEISGDIEEYINSAINSAKEIIKTLKNIDVDEDSEDKLTAEIKELLTEYALYYDDDLLEDLDKYTMGDISEIIEELNDSIEDFNESIEELAEDADEASDILEDCLDGYKKWQNKYGKY